MVQFNFPEFTKGDLASGWNQTRRVWVSLNGKDGAANSTGADPAAGLAMLSGYTTDVGNGRGKDFRHHFVATVAGAWLLTRGGSGGAPQDPLAPHRGPLWALSR